MTDPHQIARSLTEAQRKLVLASEPDDITGNEGCGVDIRGAQYRVAGSLCDKGLGGYTHGHSIADMYWNYSTGLAVRAIIEAEEHSK